LFASALLLSTPAGWTDLLARTGGYGAVMPMTISLPPDSADKVRFAISPLLEFGAAWHVLAGPDHHPERAGWVAQVHRALPGDLAEELAAWSFAVSAVRSTLLADPSLIPRRDPASGPSAQLAATRRWTGGGA
jgi:hypothetical protein